MRNQRRSPIKPTSKSWWILEGDWGGQIYATIPTHLTGFSEQSLRKLLHTVDQKSWACNKGQGTFLSIEEGMVGSFSVHNMGARLEKGIWINPEFNPGSFVHFLIQSSMASAVCHKCKKREPLIDAASHDTESFLNLIFQGKTVEIRQEEIPVGWFAKRVKVNQSRMVVTRFYCSEHIPTLAHQAS